MATLLKVLTVFLFLFAIAAFVFGLANFNKREELIGRTHELEEFAKNVSAHIEKVAPEKPAEGTVDHDPGYWDQDEPQDRPVDAITTTDAEDFWSEYKDELETEIRDTFNLGAQEDVLSTYYHMVPDENGELVVEKDRQGRKITKGKGTMHDLLEEVVARAEAQRAQLQASRRQLKDLREQMEQIVQMLNEQKKLRRENLAEITRLNGVIAEKDTVIAQKETEIARLEREIDDKNDEISTLQADIAQKDQDLQDAKTEIERLKERIRVLLIDKRSTGTDDTTTVAVKGAVAPGEKGRIVKVDQEQAFVIVQFTDEAVAEIRSEDGAFAPIELMVHRPKADGTPGKIITRIRVTTPPAKNNLAIADNKYGWEQEPVQVGDVVIY